MTDDDRRAIVAEIAAMLNLRDRAALPGPNVTASELAREVGISDEAAMFQLRCLEREGRLASGLVVIEGHRRRVFWKNEGGRDA